MSALARLAPTLAPLVVAACALSAVPAAQGAVVAGTPIPAAHARACAKNEVANPETMTLMTTVSAQESSRAGATTATAYLYGDAASSARCVVLSVRSKIAHHRKGSDDTFSSGYAFTSANTQTFEGGAPVPMPGLFQGWGGMSELGGDGKAGAHEALDAFNAQVGAQPQEPIPAEYLKYFPAAFAAALQPFSGLKSTIEQHSISFDVTSTARYGSSQIVVDGSSTQHLSAQAKAKLAAVSKRRAASARLQFSRQVAKAQAARDSGLHDCAATPVPLSPAESALCTALVATNYEEDYDRLSTALRTQLWWIKEDRKKSRTQAPTGQYFEHQLSLVVPIV